MNTDVLLQREQVEAAFISKVYGWMSAALVITGVVAMWAASTPAVLQAIFPASEVCFLFIY